MGSLSGGNKQSVQNFRGISSRGLLCKIVVMANDSVSCSQKPLKVKTFYSMVIIVENNVLYS